MQAQHRSDRAAKVWMVFLPRLVIIALLLIVSGGIVKVLMATRAESKMKPPESLALLVDTVEVIHRPAHRVWSGYGTVRTMGSADIVAEVAGRVIDRPEAIEAGNRVHAGDLIVQLDDTDSINALDAARQAANSLQAQITGLTIEIEQMQTQVQLAQEEIQAAQRDLDRTDEAIAAGAGSSGERDVKLAALLRSRRAQSVLQQQLDLIPSRRARLEAELSSQRANERIAEENVSRAKIRVPIDGELQTVNTRVGDWLGLGAQVARVVDVSRLEIPLKVAASASSWIKVGDEVHVWVREPGGKPDQIGQVRRIAPEADSSSRTVVVFVEIEQDPTDSDRILPGQFVSGRVLTHDPHARVILPRRAVQSDTVFVAGEFIDGQRVIEIVAVKVAYSFETRLPEIDPDETQWVAIEIGYEPVEHSKVVVSLLDQLSSQMRVRIAGDPEPIVVQDMDGTDEGDSTSEVSP